MGKIGKRFWLSQKEGSTEKGEWNNNKWTEILKSSFVDLKNVYSYNLGLHV